MSFTAIPLENEVVLPAIPEKVFSAKWLSHIRINSDVETRSKIVIHSIPYNGSETLPEPIEITVIEDIFSDMQDERQPVELRQLKAQVMEGIFQLYNAETQYRKELIRLEAERIENERLAQIEAQRIADELEAQRIADEEARIEAERILAAELAIIEAQRVEIERIRMEEERLAHELANPVNPVNPIEG